VLHVFKSVLSLDHRSGLAEGSRSNDTRLYRRCLCAVAVSVKKQHPAIGNRALPAYSANWWKLQAHDSTHTGGTRTNTRTHTGSRGHFPFSIL